MTWGDQRSFAQLITLATAYSSKLQGQNGHADKKDVPIPVATPG